MTPHRSDRDSRSGSQVTDAKRRVLDQLKRGGPSTVPAIAGELKLTQAAVRQHLQALQANGLVEHYPGPLVETRRADGARRGVGRPARRWALTTLAAELFPDRHADLTLELITSMREAIGDEGVEAVIRRRAVHQVTAYEAVLGKRRGVQARVEALAAERSREGYMAEVVAEPGASKGDGVLLVEHHCPICEAAEACTGLCDMELEVFQEVLGDDVEVERVQHLLSGDARCVYRVTKKHGGRA